MNTDPSSRHYIVTLPNGTEVNVFNLSSFAREHDLNYSSLSKIMNPNTALKSHKKYKVRRNNET